MKKSLFLFLFLLAGPLPLVASVNLADKLIFDNPNDPVTEARKIDEFTVLEEPNMDSTYGVYYGINTKEKFQPTNYSLFVGSMRKNLDVIAKKHGWKLDWSMETDYDIPVAFNVQNKRLPELFSTITEQLPVKVTFYTRNKVIVVMPLFDKRESEIGHKYSNS